MIPLHQTRALNYAQYRDVYATEKPYVIVGNMPWLPDSEKTNITFGRGPEELITDVRGRQQSFMLDQHGVSFAEHTFSPFDVNNEDDVKRVFYPQAEEFLKSHVENVDRVLFFNYRVRLYIPEPEARLVDVAKPTQALPPARGVHIDQSANGALKRVQLWMGEEADTLLRGRVRILNTWVPYAHVIEDCPLAMCVASTVRQENILVADHITRTYTGETVYSLYDPNAKWYYLSNQSPGEVLILKIFDSDETVPASCTPRTFELRDKIPDAKPRHSFEIRSLVFTYPEKDSNL